VGNFWLTCWADKRRKPQNVTLFVSMTYWQWHTPQPGGNVCVKCEILVGDWPHVRADVRSSSCIYCGRWQEQDWRALSEEGVDTSEIKSLIILSWRSPNVSSKEVKVWILRKRSRTVWHLVYLDYQTKVTPLWNRLSFSTLLKMYLVVFAFLCVNVCIWSRWLCDTIFTRSPVPLLWLWVRK